MMKVHSLHHNVQVGPWSIKAELDPTKTAALEIQNSDRKAALAVNKALISIQSEQYETVRQDSSILVEKLPGRDIVIESSDSGPTQQRASSLIPHPSSFVTRQTMDDGRRTMDDGR
jgi:hypothetical protein